MSANDISNGRPIIEARTAKVPNWLDFGALAYWPLQEESALYLDEGSEMWDITYTAMNRRTHDLLSGVHLKQAAAAFGTGTYADARIVSEMSLAILFRSEGVAALGGIFCYATGATTDALWGIGCNASNQPTFFDKRHSGAVIPTTLFMTAHAQTRLIIATRSATGVVKIYDDGALVRTTGAVAAPSVLGTEVIAVGGRNMFSHAGLWSSELSADTVKEMTRYVKPWLTL